MGCFVPAGARSQSGLLADSRVGLLRGLGGDALIGPGS